ncbi:methyltransferase domain-containing protein [Actinocatenispora rupis]|nr:methyltransferase domain-containing protein [Actinocatenispora rupis]
MTDETPPAYLAALDRFETLPTAVALRARITDLLAVPAGGGVVDVGCGAGRAVDELAAAGLAPCGVDADPAMVRIARSRYGHDFRVADATALPLADASVAGYRAEKVFHELPDPGAALAEAYRVVVPGGRAVLASQDWDLIGVAADDVAATRAKVHALADRLPGGSVARRFPELLARNGFGDVRVVASAGVFTGYEMVEPVLTALAGGDDGWLAEQRRRSAEGTLLVVVPLLVAVGVRR